MKPLYGFETALRVNEAQLCSPGRSACRSQVSVSEASAVQIYTAGDTAWNILFSLPRNVSCPIPLSKFSRKSRYGHVSSRAALVTSVSRSVIARYTRFLWVIHGPAELRRTGIVRIDDDIKEALWHHAKPTQSSFRIHCWMAFSAFSRAAGLR